jgi:hypothetical protein
MKKISILLIFAVLLSACSMSVNEFLGITPTPTLVPTSTITSTPTDVPTFTPTVPTPTFTVTPTMVGLKEKTSTPASTPTLLILTPLITIQPSTTPLVIVSQVPMKGFVKISVSVKEFYKGKACQPVSAKFVVQVADPSSVAFVVLFVRFKSKQSGATSDWTSIPMQGTDVPGVFTHELLPLEMRSLDSFENAWVQYQIVSTDANSKQVGRSDIFSDRLTLLECDPALALTASITPTPPP